MPQVKTPRPRPAIANPALTRPDWTVRSRNTEDVLALDKNENTDPAFQQVVADVIANIPVRSAMEYPECAPYYQILADHLGLSPENLLFTHGSDGAIRTVFEAFVSEGDVVLQTSPSFAMYPIYTSIYGGRTVEVRYRSSPAGPQLSCEAMCSAITEHRPRLFCLPNPDSPTGTMLSLSDIENLVQQAADVGAVMLLDEAYFPFSSVTGLGLIDRFPNLVVTQTFAKAWGIAGMRLGFAAAHPAMAKILHKVRPMYDVNSVALAVMAGLIERHEEVLESVEQINAGRDWFLSRMEDRGFKTFRCAGNFFLVDFGEHKDSVFAVLAGKVLYREQFHDASLEGYSRFTSAPRSVLEKLEAMIRQAIAR